MIRLVLEYLGEFSSLCERGEERFGNIYEIMNGEYNDR